MPYAPAAVAGGEVVGILLAAGRSRRFGADKLLHPLADGTPLAVAAARSLKAAGPALAVLRPGQQALARLLREEGLAVALTSERNAGMGESLACGVAAAPFAAGWLVALADMPFVNPATVRAVRLALDRGARLAAPHVDGRRGHPVGFAACWGDALQALRGDQGARALLHQHAAQIHRITCSDHGALRDVDTPESLAE